MVLLPKRIFLESFTKTENHLTIPLPLPSIPFHCSFPPSHFFQSRVRSTSASHHMPQNSCSSQRTHSISSTLFHYAPLTNQCNHNKIDEPLSNCDSHSLPLNDGRPGCCQYPRHNRRSMLVDSGTSFPPSIAAPTSFQFSAASPDNPFFRFHTNKQPLSSSHKSSSTTGVTIPSVCNAQ
jgi:hypothetical protein